MKRWLKIVLSIVGVLFALFIFLLILVPDSEDRKPTNPVESTTSLFSIGKTVTLSKCIAALNVDSYNNMVKKIEADDIDGLKQMYAQDEIIDIKDGTQAKILVSAKGCLKVKLLSGRNEWREYVFVQAANVDLANNTPEDQETYSSIMRGDEITILKPTMGAVTVKDYNEMVNLLSVNDMRSITNMVLAGQVLLFENNTKGLVLEAPYGRKRVRILEGVHEYKDCWIMDEYIEK